jgi:hypothetical protein
MNVSTIQVVKTIDRGTREPWIISSARDKPITVSRFEHWFCAVLIALIFVALVIVAAELNHRAGHFVQQSTPRMEQDSRR